MRLARAGIAHLKEQIEAHGIDCDWREQGKYQAAVTDRGVTEYLEPFAEALARLREPFEWIEASTLREKLGTGHFTRAVHTRRSGALMNPVALVRGLADSLPGNVDLYEHTPALSVEYANGTRVTTPEGTVRASTVHPRRERIRARLRSVRATGPADGGAREPEPPSR